MRSKCQSRNVGLTKSVLRVSRGWTVVGQFVPVVLLADQWCSWELEKYRGEIYQCKFWQLSLVWESVQLTRYSQISNNSCCIPFSQQLWKHEHFFSWYVIQISWWDYNIHGWFQSSKYFLVLTFLMFCRTLFLAFQFLTRKRNSPYLVLSSDPDADDNVDSIGELSASENGILAFDVSCSDNFPRNVELVFEGRSGWQNFRMNQLAWKKLNVADKLERVNQVMEIFVTRKTRCNENNMPGWMMR